MSKINIYFIIINIISFLFFMIDKIKAKYHLWRIPEKVLFILSFIGGGIGSLISMKTFHHKTKKNGISNTNTIFSNIKYNNLYCHKKN